MAVKLVLSVLTLIEVSAALEWTSAGSLQNGTTIPACPGQDVTLPWSFSTDAAEHLTNVEWHYTPQGGSEVLLATQAFGTFLAIPTASLHLEFIPNAGIRLHNVAIADTGTYSVHVNINLHGSVVTEVQTVDVHVSDDPLTTDGQLHAKMLPDAVYDNSTQQFNVQLSCGNFKTEWEPKVSVLWKTPSNETLPSTSNANGRFLLSVPNPVVSGEYSCAIQNTSPAHLCLQSGSPLQRGATVVVDGVQAQMTIMESRMKAQQANSEALITQLNAKMTQLNASSQQEISSLKQQVETLTSKLGTASKSISFHAPIRGQIYNGGDRLLGGHVITNDGNGYDVSTGIFTAPVSGTYVFLVSLGNRHGHRVFDARADLMVDNVRVGMCISSYPPSYYVTGSCHAVVQLTVGQRVFLRNAFADSYLNDDLSMFSGALLHADV